MQSLFCSGSLSEQVVTQCEKFARKSSEFSLFHCPESVTFGIHSKVVEGRLGYGGGGGGGGGGSSCAS
ncbi:hypothetical protein M0802_003184 [Mischocyttarus mexicanus]|nr:hypothetical protein M0802_003184 [Mischocyttarus mexicanus]